MIDANNTSEALVVTTNHNEYYVIPKAILEQYRATPEQRQHIDEQVTSMVPGSFAPLDADEASAKPTFASEPETTALAWFQNA